MRNEIISRLQSGQSVANEIITHYAENRPLDELAPILQHKLPLWIKGLYEATDLTDIVFNFFVIPRILNELDLPKKLHFIGLLIQPALSELAWIKNFLEPTVPFDIYQTQATDFVQKYHKKSQQEDKSIAIQKKDYINTVLALSMVNIASNQIPVSQGEKSTELAIQNRLIDRINEQIKQATFPCLWFLVHSPCSTSMLNIEPLEQLIALLAQEKLLPTDEGLIKICSNQLHGVFYRIDEIPLIRIYCLAARVAAIVSHYQDETALNEPLQTEISEIMNISLTDRDKPFRMFWGNQIITLMNFVRFILMETPVSNAQKKLKILASALITGQEFDTGSLFSSINFLCGCYAAYKQHPALSVIREVLIEFLTIAEREPLHYLNFLPQLKASSFSECFLTLCELDDFKLAFALCLSTIPSKYLQISKRGLLKKITSDHESKGILDGWYAFSNELQKTDAIVDTMFLTIFKGLFQMAFFEEAADAISKKNGKRSLPLKKNRFSMFFDKVNVILTNYTAFYTLVGEEHPVQKRNLKLQPWINLLNLTLAEANNEQLIYLFSFIQHAEPRQLELLRTILLNMNYLTTYFQELYGKAKQPVNPRALLDFDSVSTLLASEKKKYKVLPSIKLDELTSNPKAFAHYLLAWLLVACRVQHTPLTSAQKTVWKAFVFTILEQLNKTKNSADKIRASSILHAIKALIETQDLSLLFPVEEQRQLLEIIFSEEENSEANERRRNFQELLQTELIREEEEEREKERGVKIVRASKKSKKTSETTSTITTTTTASTTTTTPTLVRTSPAFSNSPEVPDAFLFEGIGAIHSPINDFNSDLDDEEEERPLTTSPILPEILLEPISPMQKFSATDQLLKQLHRSRKQLQHEIVSMESISGLPRGFLAVIGTVKSHLEALDIVLSSAVLIPIVGAKLSTPYNRCDDAKNRALEFGWNKALSQFCWNLLCESKKQLVNSEITAAEREQFTSIAGIINALSRGYFKNFDLVDMPVNQKRALDHIAAYCRKNNFSIIVQGSNFTDPTHANDLDLLIIPNGSRVVTQDEIDVLMNALVEKMPLSSIRKATFFTGKMYQHPLIVEGEHHFDLNFLFKPLEPMDELNKTAEALLTCTAVHWHYPDGHAVMLPQTARSICTERPVLSFLGSIKGERNASGYQATVAAYPPHANLLGYLAKNIMKFNQGTMRLDPFLMWFKEYYLTAKTPESRPPEAISAILKYLLLKELRKRPQQTIEFILDTQLMRVLVPFNESSFDYQVGERNFKRYFSASGNYQFIQSPNLFLAVFVLCILLDKPPTEKPALLGKLNAMHEFCGIKLSLIVDTLTLLPNEPNQLNVWTSLFKAGTQLKGLNYRNESALNLANKILNLWSRKGVNPQKTLQVEAEPTTTQNPTMRPYTSDRFFAPMGLQLQSDSHDHSFQPSWGQGDE